MEKGRSVAVATGRVLQFDDARGYGFIAADDGGEDVFLHASVFDGDSSLLVPGLPVEFKTMAGDRGRKAYAVHVLQEKSDATQRAEPISRPAPESSVAASADEEEVMCDVLSEAEFMQDITSMLLERAPNLTGSQIVQVRQCMVEFARKRGWVDA